MQTLPAHLKRLPPLGLILLVFILATIAINPLYETATMDDWAYALTVKRLLETGQYHLHDWLAANMPFQAGWGALFSLIFGYSQATLRVSTWVLALVGLVSFYGLAREHDLEDWQAALLCLILLSSSLLLRMSFSFMTDVPFLSLCILAMWIYTRALRLQSVPLMLLGSLAAAAAILIRQFGAAFLPGLGILWLIDRNRWKRTGFYAAGVIAPLAALGWQLYAGFASPNWAASWVRVDQAKYMREPIFLFDLVWRVGVVLEYAGFFALPLVIGAIADFTRESRQMNDLSQPRARQTIYLITGIGALIFVPSLIGVLVLHRRGILPIIPWNFDAIAAWPPILSALLTLICVIGGVLFGRPIMLRFLGRARQDRPLHEWLLDTVTLFLMLAPLVFLQFGDEYLLPILPYSLIVVGRVILPHLSRIILGSIVGVALAILMVSILWERDYLAYNATMWSASEALRQEGVVPEEIASLWEWESYYGSVDRFIASTNGSQSVSYYFQIWLPEQQANARYQVTTESVDRNKWQKITCIPYWNMWLRQQQVCSYKRTDH